VYKVAKSRDTKVELISSAKISTSLAKARQSRKVMQADDGEEASPPSSPTAPLRGSERYEACPILIPQDCPRRFWLCSQACLPRKQQRTSGSSRNEPSHRWNLVRGDDFKVHPLSANTRLVCSRGSTLWLHVVDKKRLKSCLLKHLFWRKFSNQKNRPNPLEMLCRTSC